MEFLSSSASHTDEIDTVILDRLSPSQTIKIPEGGRTVKSKLGSKEVVVKCADSVQNFCSSKDRRGSYSDFSAYGSRKEREELEESENAIRNCYMLDLSNKTKADIDEIEAFDCLQLQLCLQNNLQLVCVLILRNNQLSDITSMNLTEMRCLTDLDLAHNAFKGAVSSRVFPELLLRLDLSGNYLDDLTGLLSCMSLISLNASNNCIKMIPALPSSLIELDLSYNRLASLNNLRLLTFSPSITVLRVAGNPIVETSRIYRVTLCSILSNLEQLDDDFRPGLKLRQKHLKRDDEESKKLTPSKVQQRNSDLIRFDEHEKRLIETKRKQDKILKDIDDQTNFLLISPDGTVYHSPNRKDQQVADDQRTQVYQRMAMAAHQERSAFIHNLDVQAAGKRAVLDKDSTKQLIGRLSLLSPHKHNVSPRPFARPSQQWVTADLSSTSALAAKTTRKNIASDCSRISPSSSSPRSSSIAEGLHDSDLARNKELNEDKDGAFDEYYEYESDFESESEAHSVMRLNRRFSIESFFTKENGIRTVENEGKDRNVDVDDENTNLDDDDDEVATIAKAEAAIERNKVRVRIRR
jgi:hypothetical protein